MNTLQLQLFQQTLEKATKLYSEQSYSQALQKYQQLQLLSKQLSQNHHLNILSLLGLIYSKLNNSQNAIQKYNQVLTKNSLHSITLLRRAHQYIKLIKFDEALTDLNKCMKLEPDNTNVSKTMEELQQKLIDLKQSEKIKYTLKKKISQVLYKQDEQLFLNFNTLKEIDSISKCSNKSKSVMFNKNQQIHEIQHNNNQDDIQKVVRDTQTIKKIQQQQQKQLNPMVLQQQLSDPPQIKLIFKRLDSKSILRESKKISQLQIEDLNPLSRRISVLSIKNIDGKIIHRNQVKNRQKQLSFGFVDDIQEPKDKFLDTPPSLTQKKSSMKKSKFYFQQSPAKINFGNFNIDGKIINSESKQIQTSIMDQSLSSNTSMFSSHGQKISRKDSILKKPGTMKLRQHGSVMFSDAQ